MEKKKPLLKEFFSYILRPKLEVAQKFSLKRILYNVFRLWSLTFILSIIFAFLANILIRESGYSEENFALTEIIGELPHLWLFLLIVVWAPISEEIAFRLCLRFSPLNWGLGLSFLALFILSFLELPFIPEGAFLFDSWFGVSTSIILISSVFFVVFFLLKMRPGVFIEKFFVKYFHIFFYLLTLSFAFLHFTNYDVDLKTIGFFAPILIAPQFFLSFTISFVRMRYGFFWAVFTHALNNGIAITPILLLSTVLNIDEVSLETMNIVEAFSVTELVYIFLVGFFFVFILTACFFSILSLILEFIKKK